jgi:hypothetical protein
MSESASATSAAAVSSFPSKMRSSARNISPIGSTLIAPVSRASRT